MRHPLQTELKKEFQLERMILFSDAVFAIAITLLAIEIKVPEIAKSLVNDHLLGEKLGELVPKFIGFFVSFLIIALYWVIHHRTFGFVINYDQRLLWLNLFFLFAIVLMPFSSGFYSSYVLRGVKWPAFIYIANILLLCIMSIVLWEYIANPKHQLSEGITPGMTRYFRFQAVLPPIAFILVSLAYVFATDKTALLVSVFIVIAVRVIKKYYLPANIKTT